MRRSLETYRRIFKEEILPSFPQARRRFEERFVPSVELIRELPLAIGRGLEHNHPLYPEREMRRLGLTVMLLDQDLALVALGLKPMALCQGHYSELMDSVVRQLRPSLLFHYAGLELRRRGDSMEIFDPESLAQAERMEECRKSSQRVSGHYGPGLVKAGYPHHHMGFPEPLRPKDGPWEEMELISGSRGYLEHPRIFYIAHFACKIYGIEPSASTLRSRASASALIEDIRKSPGAIESFAMIRMRDGRRNRYLRSVLIKRSEGGPGEWAVREHKGPSDQSTEAFLPSK